MPARARQCVIVAGMRVGSGTDACVHACRSVARVHLWWVSDAGGTALIDPS